MIQAYNSRHIINGQDFGEPRNWQGLEINIDFLNKKEGININIADVEFVHKAKEYLSQRIMNGLTGGVGIFEGEPYDIELGPHGNPFYVFKGYLDFTDDLTKIGNEEIICSLKKRKGTDWLNDVADAYSFAYLYDQGVITDSDFVKVPYVINYIPDGMQLIILSMSLFMMTKELIENIQAIAEAIGDVTDAATPVVGVSVGLGAGVVTAWDLGNFILVTLKLIARIAYTIAIVIAIKNLIEEIFEQLLPKQREHLGMTFKKMFEKFLQYKGLTLSSSLLNTEGNIVHIPPKDKKGGEAGLKGFPTNSSAIYTPGDLIRVCNEMWNADFRIIDNVFYYERKDYFETTGTYIPADVFNDQTRLLDKLKFNTSEIIANYNIYYQYDTQDQNTLDDQTGRVFQAITTPVTKINDEFVSIKNLAEISIPFSLGKCKTSLTKVEEIAKSLGQFVDNLTGIFGGGTNFESQIENRLGSLLLSSHFLTYGKLVAMNGSKLATDQRGIINARKNWDKYHFINSFAEINGKHNQWYRFEQVRVPMTLEDFEKIIDNHIGLNEKGDKFVIEQMKYLPEGRYAVIDFRINKKYTNNLKIDYVE